MFLRPQHLQQQSLYFESLLTQQLRSANPFLWGVRTLELDEDALAARRIQVKTFEAVLPDGTLVRTGDNVTVEARSFEAGAVPLDVWIGLRRPRTGESTSALPDEARRDVRYHLHSQSVEDQNRPESKTGIDFQVPNLRLYLSGEQLEVEQCEAIRVARIVPSSDKKKIFEAATDYAPPLLVLQASSALTSAMEEVLSLLEGRIPVVSGRMATISIADLPKLWMRYTLARATPLLRQLLESKATPPFALYLYLVELAGALGAFRLSAHAQFPKYEHEDPYPCFAYLFEQIKLDLKDALPDRFKEIRLPFEKAAYQTKDFSSEHSDVRNQVYLGIKSRLSRDELLEVVKQSAKVASSEWITVLEGSQLAGIPVDPLPGPPSDIAAEPGFEFWRVELRGKDNEKHYRRMRDSSSFAVSLGNLKDADVRLYIVSPSA
jgi:type VI secretion system protein ImpJ